MAIKQMCKNERCTRTKVHGYCTGTNQLGRWIPADELNTGENLKKKKSIRTKHTYMIQKDSQEFTYCRSKCEKI